jgi:hypothetical protein
MTSVAVSVTKDQIKDSPHCDPDIYGPDVHRSRLGTVYITRA